MYTIQRFNSLLAQAQQAQINGPVSPSIEAFLDFAKHFVLAQNERTDFYKNRLVAESATTTDLQSELDDCLADMSAKQSKISILTFRDAVHRIVKKQRKEKQFIERVGQSAREFAIEADLKAAQEEVVEVTVQNAKLASDFAKEVAGHNARLAEEANTLREVFQGEQQKINAARQRDGMQLTELQNKLEHALAQEEQTSQQNNILLSQMSAIENQHSILNPVYWSKASWYSFAIGAAFGEQVIEQYTDYKPIRRLVSCGAKKLFGKSNSQNVDKQMVPESLKPAMTGIDAHEAHVSVPTVPVVQVHN